MRQIFYIKEQIVSILIVLFSYSTHFSQNHDVLNAVFTSNQAKIKDPIDQLSFSGNYRFLGFVRNQQEVFPNNSGKTTAIMSGDFFREPMFLLKVKGKTKDNVSFGADLMINSLYFDFQLYPETFSTKGGGDFQKSPDKLNFEIVKQSENSLSFKVPNKKGFYRIFVFVRNEINQTSVANIPFKVEQL
jgi:hypothetical protein